ncbi:MAG TPA: hypothetical protein ENH60_00145 [Pricia sp.]|nr:hypothetical protein [Pricia sp.]
MNYQQMAVYGNRQTLYRCLLTVNILSSNSPSELKALISPYPKSSAKINIMLGGVPFASILILFSLQEIKISKAERLEYLKSLVLASISNYIVPILK